MITDIKNLLKEGWDESQIKESMKTTYLNSFYDFYKTFEYCFSSAYCSQY